MELENVPFDLPELFTACRTIIMPKAAEKGITLHFYTEPPIGKKLLGDPTKLRQILLNLLTNAVKFTNTGIVKLSATVNELPNGTISVYFEVSDSGIGMSPEQLARIFNPFEQAESGTVRQYGGTGLGLTIAKNMVELMGGKLTVESTLKVGSIFSFELTFNTIDMHGDAIREIIFNEFERPIFNGEILLCEDNKMNQEVICKHLERVGIKTLVAENGKEGVDMVRRRMERGEKPFDLIFMDIHMPVMDGLEAASQIAALGIGTPIVAMTANIIAHDRELYLQNKMHDCVGKPFRSQELWSCLMKFLTPVEWKVGDESRQTQDYEDLLRMLTVKFVKNNQNRLSDITKAIDAGDIKLAHRLAHTLRSNAGQLGKTDLQKAAGEVEYLLKDEINSVTPAHMNILETELNAVLEELAPLTKGHAPKRPKAEAFDAEQARELLEILEPMFEDGDLECLKFIDSLRLIPGSEDLIRKMENLDFEPATAALAQLRERIVKL
jgi:CheY-like chemotaxis protein